MEDTPTNKKIKLVRLGLGPAANQALPTTVNPASATQTASLSATNEFNKIFPTYKKRKVGEDGAVEDKWCYDELPACIKTLSKDVADAFTKSTYPNAQKNVQDLVKKAVTAMDDVHSFAAASCSGEGDEIELRVKLEEWKEQAEIEIKKLKEQSDRGHRLAAEVKKVVSSNARHGWKAFNTSIEDLMKTVDKEFGSDTVSGASKARED